MLTSERKKTRDKKKTKKIEFFLAYEILKVKPFYRVNKNQYSNSGTDAPLL